MPKKSKKIASEDSGLENLSVDLGIRVSGRTLMWGPYVVGYIVGTRGSVIKAIYACPVCGAVYSHARNWRYHLRSKHPDFLRAMTETSYELLEAYRARIRRLKGEASGVTSTSSVSSVPATSSVSMSRSIEEALRRQLAASLRVPLPPPNLPVLNPKWPKWPFEGEGSK